MKRISKQFKLGNEFTIICNHKDAVLADNGIYNLGTCTLWLCMNCSARVRDSVLTSLLTDSAKLVLRGDEELQQLIKTRIAVATQPVLESMTKAEMDATIFALKGDLETVTSNPADFGEDEPAVVSALNKLEALRARS